MSHDSLNLKLQAKILSGGNFLKNLKSQLDFILRVIRNHMTSYFLYSIIWHVWHAPYEIGHTSKGKSSSWKRVKCVSVVQVHESKVHWHLKWSGYNGFSCKSPITHVRHAFSNCLQCFIFNI